MYRGCLVLGCGVVLALLGGSATVVPRVADASPHRLRVLLLGNSYTRFNVMPRLVRRIADSVPDGPRMRVDSVALAGYTLRMHWNRTETLERIRNRAYTHVVLQGHSLAAIEHAEEFVEYAEQFHQVIGESSARTVLYETWARRGGADFYRTRSDVTSSVAMQSIVGDAYSALAGSLDALVAPVGQAFARSELQSSNMPLHRPDDSHPTVLGSYLAALVLYGTVSDVDPARSKYRPFPVTPRQARIARALATDVLARRAHQLLVIEEDPPPPLEIVYPAAAAVPVMVLQQPELGMTAIDQPVAAEVL